MHLHAYGAEDSTHGACRPPLFPDYFSHVLWSNAEFEHGVLIVLYRFYYYRTWVVDQGPGNFCYQLLHVV